MPDDEDHRPIDLSRLPPAFWSAMLDGVFDDLSVGDQIELISAVDPTPIRRLLEALLPGRFDWFILASGPVEWRVRIVRRRPRAGGGSRRAGWNRRPGPHYMLPTDWAA